MLAAATPFLILPVVMTIPAGKVYLTQVHAVARSQVRE